MMSDDYASAYRTAPLRVAVDSTCTHLQKDYLDNTGDARMHSSRAILASLRRVSTLEPSKYPLEFENVLMTLNPRLEEKALGKGDAPSPSERAAFAAMTLFSIHMESATSPMHNPRVSFATACGMLIGLNESASIKPRVDAMLLAGNENSRMIHMRSLINLLRRRELPCDYGSLAEDLRRLSYTKSRPGVQLRWGRDIATGVYRASQTNSTHQ